MKVWSYSPKFALTALALASMPFAVANADYDNQNAKRLIAETLLDSAANRQADGSSTIQNSEIQDFIVWDDPSGQRYVKTFESKGGVHGEFRITLGMKGVADPRPPLWKLVKHDTSKNVMVWSRPLMEGGTLYVQSLARFKNDEMVLDVFLTAPRSTNAVEQALQQLTVLRRKSEQNNLFRPEVMENPSFAGLWKGPMTNTKGDSATNSMLKLVEARDGSISGVWHAGWKVTNVEREGNTLKWEHSNVGGCRDYKNTLVLSPSLREAELRYKAYDRCKFPHIYEGQANLSRQLKN